MDGYESTRREFLKKLGLIAGATALTATGMANVAPVITDKKEKYTLTAEQDKFMQMYEKWLDEFHAMAKFQKVDAEHLGNNKRLMELSDQASGFQKQLIAHMKDENFQRYYMIVTERVTTVI
jgi:hypothetical protein